MSEPVKVTVSDPETGEILQEAVIDNDYVVVAAGSANLFSVQVHGNGTHVLTVKGVKR